MGKPTLYIMCGLPFSGKTTLAKEIADYTGSEQIAFDWIWYEKEKVKVPDIENTDEWNSILQIAYDRMRQLLLSGMSVVYDEMNARKSDRERLVAVAKECNAAYKIIYLNIPQEVIQRRREKNRISKERHDVASVNFDKALENWQNLRGEANIVEYTPETEFTSWAKQL